MAIFSILAALAVPSYIHWLPEKRLKMAARDIKSNMELVKMRAIRENEDAVITFDVNNDTYTAYVDADGDRTQDAGEPTILSRDLPADIDMYNTSLVSHETFFDSRGLPSGGSGYVYMVNTRTEYRRVDLSLAGLIKIQKSTDGGTWTDA